MYRLIFSNHFTENSISDISIVFMSTGRGEESTEPFSVSKLGKWVELTNFPTTNVGIREENILEVSI